MKVYLYWVSKTEKETGFPTWLTQKEMEVYDKKQTLWGEPKTPVLVIFKNQKICLFDKCVANARLKDWIFLEDETITDTEKKDSLMKKGVERLQEIFKELEAEGYTFEELNSEEFQKIKDIDKWTEDKILGGL